MSTRLKLRGGALLGALALGVLGDALLQVPGRPGLNAALWSLAGVAVLAALLHRRAGPPTREARWLVSGAAAFACALVLRDAGALAVFALLSALVLLVLAAGRAATAWATTAQLSDTAVAALRVAVLCAAGPLGWGRGAPDAVTGRATWTRQARTAVRGTVLALPALLVLTALLMSADPVFARIINAAILADIEPLFENAAFAVAVAWFSAGYLRAFLVRDDIIPDRLRIPHPALATGEVVVALWILNVLFVAFMAVQLRYLFGGAGLVEVTAGLTYAEYARRGFFELVAAAALVVPILLLADWAAGSPADRSADRPRARLRPTMLVLMVLLLGVIGSAAYRMRLYQGAYGLTELRLYVSMVIVWLTLVLAWMAFSVLRGQRQRFAFGAIVAGVLCIGALHVINPHGLIARVNIQRAAAGAEYDGTYLAGLSADAVPAVLAQLQALPEVERCRAGNVLQERWSGARPGGWRTWNLGDWRTRRLVREGAGTLGCPEMA